jgi:hypothetical protein
MDKKKVAVKMFDLQQAFIVEDIALVFAFMDELERLTNEEYSMKVVWTFTEELPAENLLVSIYFKPMIEKVLGGEA